MSQDTTTTADESAAQETHKPPDYDAVDYPTDKPRTEWHYTHRRAELLELLKEAGHPDDLNQSELAEKYDVDQSTISRDLDRIGEAVRENRDMDRHFLTLDSVLQRCVRGLIDDGDYRKAAQTALEYDDWIHQRIEAERFRERIERLEQLADSDSARFNQ